MKTRQELIDAQKQLCKEKNSPFFMPGDGNCWSCHRDIVESYRERMEKEVITGCPLCCRSYCD